MGTPLRWLFLSVAIFLAIFIVFHSDKYACIAQKPIQFAHQLTSKKRLTISEQMKMLEKRRQEKISRKIETAFGNKSYKDIEKLIFRPMGYKIRENSVIPALDFIRRPSCPKVFSDWLNHSKGHNESATPPRNIPAKLSREFTFGGFVHVIKGYKDDRSGTQKAVWTHEEINKAIARRPEEVLRPYGGDAAAIYHAMKAYNVSGKRGAVVGSLTPYVEAFALKLGAKHMTTMEYRHIDIQDDRIDYKHPVEVAKEASKYSEQFDFVASFSSIEHSGLGRYGDALDPIGDLTEAMKIHCMLKEKGLFFVGLPMGWDTLHWNLHRIYGRIRLALFSAGFDILEIFDRHRLQPITEELFKKPRNLGYMFQWVLVLQKR